VSAAWTGTARYHHYQLFGQNVQPASPPILLLTNDADVRRKVRALLDPLYVVHEVREWTLLGEALAACPPHSVVVADPYASAPPGQGPSTALEELLVAFPSTPFIAAYELTGSRVDETRLLMQWGIAEILDLAHDLDPTRLVHRIGAVQRHRIRTVMKAHLPPALPTRVRAFLSVAAEVVAAGGQPADLASRLHVSERTLSRRCKKLEVPLPRRLLTWLRLLVAADMLCEGRRSVASVASALGYSSEPCLRTALKTVARTTPAEIRASGMSMMASRFCQELYKHRGGGSAAARAATYVI
jgi:AraC-like DNA-binding protein